VKRVQLIEAARVAVDEDRVPIAVGVPAALDVDATRDRIRALVALIGVLELQV
jgi:hypothetical protein